MPLPLKLHYAKRELPQLRADMLPSYCKRHLTCSKVHGMLLLSIYTVVICRTCALCCRHLCLHGVTLPRKLAGRWPHRALFVILCDAITYHC